ncbi:MAG: beta-ketoacyl-[Desulfovibrionaceae bacterium]|nr:beta-ketoacyl-[acyl-carrier-protein] synthase family protein [Desulfovibrionaceae bacterium]
MKRRVVITGLGIVSVLGCGLPAVTLALRAGKSGIASDPKRICLGFRSSLTGVLPPCALKSTLTRKERKTMAPAVVQSYTAAQEAVHLASLAPSDIATDRTGLVFGNDSQIIATLEEQEAYERTKATYAMGSGHVFRCMNSSVSVNLGVRFGIRGPCWTVSCACASAAYAVCQAFDCIRFGRLDRVLVGGCQELNWQSVASFDGIGAFSTNPDPLAASRPFDRERDGLVPSGGAAVLVLEAEDIAKKRGAKVYGEILGFGVSSDGCDLSVPDGEGLARAIEAALADAGAGLDEIDLVSAHATSTVVGDAAEAMSLSRVFHGKCPRVTALKSLTGHEFWMSGVSQIVYTAAMADAGFIAATANYTAPDAQTAGIPVVTRRIDRPANRVLHNAAGLGGANAALIVRYGEE